MRTKAKRNLNNNISTRIWGTMQSLSRKTYKEPQSLIWRPPGRGNIEDGSGSCDYGRTMKGRYHGYRKADSRSSGWTILIVLTTAIFGGTTP